MRGFAFLASQNPTSTFNTAPSSMEIKSYPYQPVKNVVKS
ncbi:hypothetical protein A679_04940 [Salmonella enterica subsp. enterica serovar Enteritidis str. 2010K-0284]|nr:hypothetical protein A679_04940 [Salmonella enterica subsp. enterica serovar Enteritidis str. 2010K-0284]